jgi:hypothetical protein
LVELELKFAEGGQCAGWVKGEVSLDLVDGTKEVSVEGAIDLFVLLGEGVVFGLGDGFTGEGEDGCVKPVCVRPVDWGRGVGKDGVGDVGGHFVSKLFLVS